jgi:phenylpyruvate tautomerase PptA (4-oxalocrotonate tautomerase family)
MPVIQLFHPQAALDAEKKAALAAKLTDVLLTMEGNARTAGGKAFSYVLFSALGADDWWIGGVTDDRYVHAPGRFLARVSVPEGYMSQAHKSEVHRLVNDAIVSTVGDSSNDESGQSILVIIEEVAEGDWGCAGKTISLASIAGTVGLSKTGDRFQWSLAYFAAKARQFAAAGYPPDTGGLIPHDVDKK